jgi:hypothetical protein
MKRFCTQNGISFSKGLPMSQRLTITNENAPFSEGGLLIIHGCSQMLVVVCLLPTL